MELPNFKKVESQWLENLLLDGDREIYHAMTPEQQRLVIFAYNYGWLVKESEQ